MFKKTHGRCQFKIESENRLHYNMKTVFIIIIIIIIVIIIIIIGPLAVAGRVL